MTTAKVKETRDFLWSMAHKKSFVSRLSNCIKDAVRWTNYPQPMGALVSPSGISCKDKFGDFRISCSPKGHGGTPVIVFSKFSLEISPAESYCLTHMVQEHAVVAETWTGGSGEMWMRCLAVRLPNPAGFDILRSLNDYMAGCPEHPKKGSLCDCGWYEKGKKKLIVPRKFNKV